jgi:CRP-like cAMP-binding protein
MLQDVLILAGIPSDALNALALKARRRRFPAGGLLMQQGEVSTGLHVILAGFVRVERGHPALKEPVELATLGAGEVVGEIGALDGEPRTATVVAIEDTETLELSTDQLADIIVRYPRTTRTLLKIVSRRLRSTDELLELIARSRDPPA